MGPRTTNTDDYSNNSQEHLTIITMSVVHRKVENMPTFLLLSLLLTFESSANRVLLKAHIFKKKNLDLSGVFRNISSCMHMVNITHRSLHLPCDCSVPERQMMYLDTPTSCPITEVNAHRTRSGTALEEVPFPGNICCQPSVFTFWQPRQMGS